MGCIAVSCFLLGFLFDLRVCWFGLGFCGTCFGLILVVWLFGYLVCTCCHCCLLAFGGSRVSAVVLVWLLLWVLFVELLVVDLLVGCGVW